jgi:hypothetical protein
MARSLSTEVFVKIDALEEWETEMRGICQDLMKNCDDYRDASIAVAPSWQGKSADGFLDNADFLTTTGNNSSLEMESVGAYMQEVALTTKEKL